MERKGAGEGTGSARGEGAGYSVNKAGRKGLVEKVTFGPTLMR